MRFLRNVEGETRRQRIKKKLRDFKEKTFKEQKTEQGGYGHLLRMNKADYKKEILNMKF